MLYLTFSPNTVQQLEDYLLSETNIVDFFQRLNAVTFNDYCTFFYAPVLGKKMNEFFDTIDDNGHSDYFLSLLDNPNFQSIEDSSLGGALFYEYLGYGNMRLADKQDIPASEVLFASNNAAFLEFSNKKEDYYTSIVVDKKRIAEQARPFKVITTFKSFIEWSSKCLPRNFDKTNESKHQTGGKSGFGSDILCSQEEAERILNIAFHKEGHHEHHLFFYHLPKETKPILFFKSAQWDREMPDFFRFHAYHISEQELNKNYRIRPTELKELSEYVIKHTI